MEVEIIRAFERLLIVAFGGTSIILGWHLFKIGVVSPQSGIFSGKGFKFSLQKVGPGIFFSLFGTVVLSISLMHGLKTITKTQDPISGSSTITEVHLAGKIQGSNLYRITKAINTLDLIQIESSARTNTNKNAIKKAIEQLRAHRDILARQKFDASSLRTYQQCKDSKDAICKLSNSYKDIQSWLTDTVLQ